MMKKLMQTALLVSALTLSACIVSLPRTPDGSLNVPALIGYAQDGIDLDCKYGATGLAKDICTFGTDALTLAKDKSPSAAKQVLLDAEKKQPKLAPYVDWLIALL